MDNKITKRKLREFALVIAFGFPLIIGYLIPKLMGHSFREWTLWIGFVSLTFGVLKPFFLLYPYKFWMLIGFILGWFNSRIIFGIIFIIVVIPISIIMNLLGYDPLKKRKKLQESFKENRSNDSIDLTKIF